MGHRTPVKAPLPQAMRKLSVLLDQVDGWAQLLQPFMNPSCVPSLDVEAVLVQASEAALEPLQQLQAHHMASTYRAVVPVDRSVGVDHLLDAAAYSPEAPHPAALAAGRLSLNGNGLGTNLRLRNLETCTQAMLGEKLVQLAPFTDLFVTTPAMLRQVLRLPANHFPMGAMMLVPSPQQPLGDSGHTVALFGEQSVIKQALRFQTLLFRKAEVVMVTDSEWEPSLEKRLMSYLQAYTPAPGRLQLTGDEVPYWEEAVQPGSLVVGDLYQPSASKRFITHLLYSPKGEAYNYLVRI